MPTDHELALLVALGRAVRDLRNKRGLTQEELAERAGVHPRYLSDIERGRRNVAIVNLDRLAGALEVSLADMMQLVGVALGAPD